MKKIKRATKKSKKKQQKRGQRYETGDTMKRANKTRKLKKKTANKNIAGAHTGQGRRRKTKISTGKQTTTYKTHGHQKKRLPMKKQSTTEPLEKQNTNRKPVFWKNRKKNYHVET